MTDPTTRPAVVHDRPRGGCPPRPLVHVGRVLDSFARTVRTRHHAPGPAPSLFAEVLAHLGFPAPDVETIERIGVERAYDERLLPVRMTLGAAVALHVAQRSEQLGLPDRAVAANVERVVARIAGGPAGTAAGTAA
jgi:hypothetical protein